MRKSHIGIKLFCLTILIYFILISCYIFLLGIPLRFENIIENSVGYALLSTLIGRYVINNIPNVSEKVTYLATTALCVIIFILMMSTGNLLK